MRAALWHGPLAVLVKGTNAMICTECSLGCVNSHPAARGSQEAGFTQPRTHSFVHPCTGRAGVIFLILKVALKLRYWSDRVTLVPQC